MRSRGLSSGNLSPKARAIHNMQGGMPVTLKTLFLMLFMGFVWVIVFLGVGYLLFLILTFWGVIIILVLAGLSFIPLTKWIMRLMEKDPLYIKRMNFFTGKK